MVLEDGQAVVKEADFQPNGQSQDREVENIMIVGVPLNSVDNGAVFMYQTLSVIEQTSNETRRIVYLSAGIAIVLTTFLLFSFIENDRAVKEDAPSRS